MKKIISFLAILVLVISLPACSSPAPQEKVFSKSGLEITLTTDFTETSMAGYTFCYESSHVVIVALKEEFSLLEQSLDMTLNEYTELLRKANTSHSPSAVSTQNGIPCFEYTWFNETENKTFRYYTTAFKGSDAFWMVQFVCADSAYATQKDNFLTWAQSITVN